MKDYSDKLSKLNFIEVFNYFSCKCCTPEYGLAAFSTGATPKTEEKKNTCKAGIPGLTSGLSST